MDSLESHLNGKNQLDIPNPPKSKNHGNPTTTELYGPKPMGKLDSPSSNHTLILLEPLEITIYGNRNGEISKTIKIIHTVPLTTGKPDSHPLQQTQITTEMMKNNPHGQQHVNNTRPTPTPTQQPQIINYE
jgi:hypothetical protein